MTTQLVNALVERGRSLNQVSDPGFIELLQFIIDTAARHGHFILEKGHGGTFPSVQSCYDRLGVLATSARATIGPVLVEKQKRKEMATTSDHYLQKNRSTTLQSLVAHYINEEWEIVEQVLGCNSFKVIVREHREIMKKNMAEAEEASNSIDVAVMESEDSAADTLIADELFADCEIYADDESANAEK